MAGAGLRRSARRLRPHSLVLVLDHKLVLQGGARRQADGGGPVVLAVVALAPLHARRSPQVPAPQLLRVARQHHRLAEAHPAAGQAGAARSGGGGWGSRAVEAALGGGERWWGTRKGPGNRPWPRHAQQGSNWAFLCHQGCPKHMQRREALGRPAGTGRQHYHRLPPPRSLSLNPPRAIHSLPLQGERHIDIPAPVGPNGAARGACLPQGPGLSHGGGDNGPAQAAWNSPGGGAGCLERKGAPHGCGMRVAGCKRLHGRGASGSGCKPARGPQMCRLQQARQWGGRSPPRLMVSVSCCARVMLWREMPATCAARAREVCRRLADTPGAEKRSARTPVR